MHAIRVVGPPGSGKTLLITALMEALRARGLRAASVVQRMPEQGSPGGTVLTLGSGARVTIERLLDLAAMRDLATTLDPAAALLLSEGYGGAGDAAFPAVVMYDHASPTVAPDTGLVITVIAEVDGADLARRFPGEGANAVALVADAVEAYLHRATTTP